MPFTRAETRSRRYGTAAGSRYGPTRDHSPAPPAPTGRPAARGRTNVDSDQLDHLDDVDQGDDVAGRARTGGPVGMLLGNARVSTAGQDPQLQLTRSIAAALDVARTIVRRALLAAAGRPLRHRAPAEAWPRRGLHQGHLGDLDAVVHEDTNPGASDP